MSPLISVAMSVLYRQEDLSLLKRSVDSILSQSLTDFELLVCCDGSTEDVHAFLRGYEAKDFRVKVVCGENKETLQEKLNVCLAAARGEFIARMDDDDFSHPDRFEKQIAFYEKVCYT